jgi:chemotaxis methyl-accepting protein methylase
VTEGFHFNDTDYRCFRDLIEERTGMLIGNNRRSTLARSLKESMQYTDCEDLSAYLSCLKASQTDSAFWDDLVKRLTIGETYFFRHSEQIESLRKNILPDLIARHWTDRTLNLWSAG